MNTIINKKRILFQLLLMTTLLFNCTKAAAQAKLVINGGVITVNGASLVIDNPDNTAIVRISSGYIKSEAAGNKIIWTIGAGNGNTYLVPFGNAAGYLPLQFKAASGIGSGGQFIFSTYPTASWKNSDNLPPGVTNVNRDGSDNSAKLIDRFWQINPQGYTTKPTLSNLVFTYADPEYNAPNTITEANLAAQSWNNGTLTWTDFPSSVTNTTDNTITIASVPGSQVYDWWTLVDANFASSVTLVSFNAVASYPKVLTNWQTAAESKSGHFEVWRSKVLPRFDSVGSIVAAGNSSSLLNYSLTDNNPYSGVSYYRLKIVAADGSYKWSAIVQVLLLNETNIVLYPNPAGNYINIAVDIGIAVNKPVARIYDAKGRLMQSFTISSANQQINISSLAAGVYRLHLIYKDKQHTLSFIKQ
jgi:Secretion system C-terminal sorting domain